MPLGPVSSRCDRYEFSTCDRKLSCPITGTMLSTAARRSHPLRCRSWLEPEFGYPGTAWVRSTLRAAPKEGHFMLQYAVIHTVTHGGQIPAPTVG